MDRLTIASPIDQRTHGYAMARRGDATRAFRKAIRHSRSVRVLRLAIPTGIAVAIALAISGPWSGMRRAKWSTSHAGGFRLTLLHALTNESPRRRGMLLPPMPTGLRTGCWLRRR